VVERRLSAGYRCFRLKKTLRKRAPTPKTLEDAMAWSVTVDADKCVGDNECVDVCPVEVYELQDGKAVPVNADECLGCESCVEVCESGAITVEEL
jgi:NAD-dependent dihydropyrimidine dehydrogenase PreA subunit